MIEILVWAGIGALLKKAADEYRDQVEYDEADEAAHRFVKDYPGARELFAGGRLIDWLKANLSDDEIRRNTYAAIKKAYDALKQQRARKNGILSLPSFEFSLPSLQTTIPQLSLREVCALRDLVVEEAERRTSSIIREDLGHAARGIQRYYQGLLGPGYSVTVTPFLGDEED